MNPGRDCITEIIPNLYVGDLFSRFSKVLNDNNIKLVKEKRPIVKINPGFQNQLLTT
jgi:hypothetical protein